MPNIKSQIKRVKTNEKATDINKAKKTRVKNAIKKFNAAIEAKDVALAEKLLPETIGIVESARLDGLYQRNTASRKISALNKAFNSIKA